MAKSFFINDELNDYFKKHKFFYVLTFAVGFIGLITGIILCLTGYNSVGILKSSGKIMNDYITGRANYFDIFFSRLKECLLIIMIIFVLNTNIYTAIFSTIFLGYQVCLFVIGCSGVLEMYGFSGFLNLLFWAIPINVLNYVILVSCNCVLLKRVFENNKLKVGFIKSFSENNVFRNFIISVILLILMMIFSSFIYQQLFKSFSVLIY